MERAGLYFMLITLEVMTEQEVSWVELLHAQGRCYSDYPPGEGFITYHPPQEVVN